MIQYYAVFRAIRVLSADFQMQKNTYAHIPLTVMRSYAPKAQTGLNSIEWGLLSAY